MQVMKFKNSDWYIFFIIGCVFVLQCIFTFEQPAGIFNYDEIIYKQISYGLT